MILNKKGKDYMNKGDKKKIKEQYEKDMKSLEERKKKLEKEIKKHNETSKEDIAKYDVKAIEFDWIFNQKEGKNFLTDLAFAGDDDVFEVDVVKNIIYYLWKFYRRAIIMQILLPFILYFVCVIAYATWINKEKDEEDNNDGTYSIINYGLIIVIGLNILFFGYLEFK